MEEQSSLEGAPKDRCEICGSAGDLIRLHQQIGPMEKELTLCRSCAGVLGIEKPGDAIRPRAADLLSAVLDPAGVGARDSRCCERCGTSFAQIRRQGLAGCSHCYDQFKADILSLLRRVSSRNLHKGRLPRKIQKVKNLVIEASEIRQQLRQALINENYEDAEALRKRIADIEGTHTGDEDSPDEGGER